MQKVNSFSHFNSLLKKLKANTPKPLTNCYLYPSEIDELSAQNKLFYIFSLDNKTGLYFFLENHTFYNLYFYMDGLSVPDLKKPEKPVVLDFVYKENRVPKQLDQQNLLWKQYGFKDYKKYIRMDQNISVLTDHTDFNNDLSANYIFGFSDHPDLSDDIQQLWQHNLDPYSIAIPESGEIIVSMENNNIFYLTDSRGKLSAALQVLRIGSKAIIQHVTVSPDSRGKGIGLFLLKKVFHLLKEQGISESQLWVDINNKSAIRLYEKCGYTYNFMISNQLLCK